MTLPKPQNCDCFGGSCWRQHCPDSSRNRKKRKDAERAAETEHERPRREDGE